VKGHGDIFTYFHESDDLCRKALNARMCFLFCVEWVYQYYESRRVYGMGAFEDCQAMESGSVIRNEVRSEDRVY